MQNNLGELQTFSIASDDAKAKKRIDVGYYQPFFEHIVKKVAGSKFELQKLEDITLLISNGRTPSKDMYDEDNDQDGSVPIIKAGTASGRFVNLEKLEYAKADFSSGKKAQKSDIFILSAAHQASYVGKNVSILEVEPKQDTYFVGELICVRANPEKVLPEYLFGFLSSEVGYFLLNREKRGQTSHIYPEDIKSILLPVPSLKDQKNIVSILMNAYEQKRKKETEILKILSSIDDFVLGELGIDMPRGGAERVFQIWSDEIQTRLDPSYFRPIFKMLDKIFSTTKYNVKTLKNLSTKITSGATPLSGGDAYTNQDSGIPFVRSGNINPDNEIDFNSLLYVKPEIHNKKLKSSQLKKGDLMIAIVGATIGQVSVYENDREANINQAIALIRLDEQVNPEYAKEFLYSKIGQIQLDRIKRPVARANINLDEVGSLQVIYPSKDKQNEMVGKIRKIRAKATELRQEAESIVAGAQKEVEQMILA